LGKSSCFPFRGSPGIRATSFLCSFSTVDQYFAPHHASGRPFLRQPIYLYGWINHYASAAFATITPYVSLPENMVYAEGLHYQ
jgi:hypothetical protein